MTSLATLPHTAIVFRMQLFNDYVSTGKQLNKPEHYLRYL